MAKNGRYETDGHGANYLFAVKPKDNGGYEPEYQTDLQPLLRERD